MNIAVVGGAGIQALVVLKDVLSNPQVKKVLVLDRNVEGARRRAMELGDGRAVPGGIDVTDVEGAASALRGVDVVANCVSAQYCFNTMEACLLAGAHYIDLGTWPEDTKRQLSLADRFKARGITGILGLGSAPGLSNMMAALVAEELDEVTSIDICIGMKNLHEDPDGFEWPYALDTILNEFTESPYAVRDGRLVRIAALSHAGFEHFDEPLGKVLPYYTIHPEPLTLFESYASKGLKEASFRIALPESFASKVKFLADLGFGSKQTLDSIGMSPRDALFAVLQGRGGSRPSTPPKQYSATRVRVSGYVGGREDRRRVEYTVEVYVAPEERYGIPAGRLKTGIPLSVGAQMLAKGEIDLPGVWPPEAAVPTGPFFRELSARGLYVYYTRKWFAA